MISLRAITDANRAELEALDVTPLQGQYVAGVADSLIEAAETPGACPWYRGVYDDDTPVGFVMISDGIPAERTEYLGPFYLWRLLIDARHQQRGHGRSALDLVVDHVRRRGGHTLLTSVADGEEGSPLGFYQRYGFALTGDRFEGERVLALTLHHEQR